MMKIDHPDDVAVVLVSYLPVPSHLGEMKTKPTQYAYRTLSSNGLLADFIVARGPTELDRPRRETLKMNCGLRSEDDIISAPDVKSIYEIPALFEKQRFSELLAKRLKLRMRNKKNLLWNRFVNKMHAAAEPLKIAVVGKYFGSGNFTLADSYISVIEAIKHAAWHEGARPELTWIDSENFEQAPERVAELNAFNAVIVPGGFGTRGIEGIISAIRYVREQQIPYMGLCYGMQLACIEFARNVLGLAGAHTLECDPSTPYPIIYVNPVQAKNIAHNRYGGTMRLGSYRCHLKSGSIVQKLYRTREIAERHRHRYEFNNEFRAAMEAAGLEAAGINPEHDLVEIVALKGHPYFVGTQFHPEFKSRPLRPHPLFVGLIKAALAKRAVGSR